MQKIISRFDGRTLYECEADTMQAALQKAVNAGSDLRYANLRGSDLRGSDLQDANLQDANLRYANLRYANLQDANLRGSNLQDANLRYANLQDANLRGSNLQDANLRGSNLRGSDLQDANLQGSYLQGSDLQDAKYGERPILNIVQLSGIGSARRMTTAVIFADEIRITCGCFRGSLTEFSAQINKQHANNPRHLDEYMAAVEWIQSCADACR